jgi:hypothetical protein
MIQVYDFWIAYPTESKAVFYRDTCTPMFVPALLTSDGINLGTHGQMTGKKNVLHIHNSTIKKNKIMSLAGK